MRVSYVLFCLFALVANSAVAAVSDPIQDYIQYYGLTKGTKIFSFTADLNGDGGKEVFVTSDESQEDSLYAWKLYLWKPMGYIMAGWKMNDYAESDVNGTVPIDINRFKIGYLPSLNRNGLITIDTHEGIEDEGTATMLAITLESDNSYRVRVVKVSALSTDAARKTANQMVPTVSLDQIKTYIVP